MVEISRRALFGAAASLGLVSPAILPAGSARAQATWPTRPVRLVIPYAAGGPSDVLARAIQPPLAAALGQSVIVENRPGGGAMIGTEVAARAEDGHTFLVADSPHTIIPAVQPRVPYDPVNDFRPISLLGAVSMLLAVNPGFPAKTLAEFLEASKARDGGATFGSSGVGSLTHLLPEWLTILSKSEFTVVPYRGSGPALLDVVSGQINAIYTSTLSAAGPLKEGQVLPIAVAAPNRIAALPETPTFREQGIDMVSSNWWGIFAQKSAPDSVVQRMEAALGKAMDDEGVKARFATLGIEARPRGPEAFASLLKREFDNWAQVAKTAGVQVQP